MSKHQPVPWLSQMTNEVHDQHAIYSEETGTTTAIAYSKADADLIVRAVNNHKRLVSFILFIEGLAKSAGLTGHTEAEVVGGNWDMVKEKMSEVLISLREGDER